MKNGIKKFVFICLATVGATIVKAQTGNNCSSAINISLSTSSSTCLSNQVGQNSSYMWYKFTAIRSVTNFIVNYDPSQTGSISNAHVYTGSCNSLVELGATVDEHKDSLKIFINILSAGQTYYIRLDKSNPAAAAATSASFTICSTPAEQLPWQVIGNDVQFDGKIGIGKTPLFPLDVVGKANISGSLIAGGASITNLGTSGNSLVIANTSGNLSPLPFGKSDQYLSGDGSWINFPAIPSSLWIAGTHNAISYTGDVAVNGNMTVSNTLYVGQGVVISQQSTPPSAMPPTDVYIHASSLNTKVLIPEIIQMDSTSKISGPATFVNDATFTQGAVFGKGVGLRSSLSVTGNSDFQGIVNIQQGINFSNQPVISFLSAAPPTGSTVNQTGGSGTMGSLILNANTNINGTVSAQALNLASSNGGTTTAISTIPGAGELSPSTIVMGSNSRVSGNLTVSSLAGGSSAFNEVYVDQNGNLKLGNGGGGSGTSPLLPCAVNSFNWNLGGNNIGAYMNFTPQPMIGTCDAFDLVFKANSNPYMWLKTDGKVGIGTATPAAHLQINVTDQAPALVITNYTNVGGPDIFGVTNDGSVSIFDADANNTNPLLTMTHTNGSTLKFLANGSGDIASSTSLSMHFAGGNNNDFGIYQGNPGSGIQHFFMAGGTGSSYFRTTDPNANGTAFMVVNDPGNGNKEVFIINNSGSTSINANSANAPDAFVINDFISNNSVTNFKVKTTGQVYAREVIVKLGLFPDYVFKKEYKLMPLLEVDKYINENGHLHNMPSASEVEQEGANLGEIQRVSVEKIEEHTLYMIEMKKEMIEMKKEIENLKKENEELKAIIKK